MATQPTPSAWTETAPAGQPTAQENPMATHVKVIAIINLVFAGLTALAALGVILTRSDTDRLLSNP